MIDIDKDGLNILADELGPGHLALCLDVMAADAASEAMPQRHAGSEASTA